MLNRETGKLAKYTAGTLLMAASIVMTGCGQSEDTAASGSSTSVQMNIPDSMTGGKVATIAAVQTFAAAASSAGSDVPCAWIGPEDGDDIFRNGYEMTKFMVSAVATWSCITDNLIELSDTVAHEGEIVQTDNDFDSISYDAEDPTHYSVTDESETQTTVRMYYAYSRATPPQAGDDAEFYFSWNETGEETFDGRLVVDVSQLNQPERKAEDPVNMRMDVSRTDTSQSTDMTLRFDEGNAWAEGFRISVTKDLTALANEQTFVARGMMEMKRQFFADTGISELPTLQMYTVSDRFGNGAAVADFIDVALPLELNAELENHLGNYIFSKNDIYVFDDNGDWDWIHKTFTSAVYRNGRTTQATGGTEIPFDPSLEGLALYFGLNTTEQTYFEGDACNVSGDDCIALFTAIYDDGFAEQEQNQGSDPVDWRSIAIETPDYLISVYPNEMDWSGAFDMVYVP